MNNRYVPLTDPFFRNGLVRRIEELRNVIAWSKEKGSMNSGQRTCIHQEIAYRLNQIDAWDNHEPFAETGYRISEELEEKVQHILGVIVATAWEKQELKY